MCSKYTAHIIHVYIQAYTIIYICIKYMYMYVYHVYRYAVIYTSICVCMYVCVCHMHTYYPQLHTLTEAGHTHELLPPYQVMNDSRARIRSSLIYSLKLSHRECSILFPAGTIPSCKHCFPVICILTELNLLLSS